MFLCPMMTLSSYLSYSITIISPNNVQSNIIIIKQGLH